MPYWRRTKAFCQTRFSEPTPGASATLPRERDADGVLRRDQAFAEYRDWHWIIKQIAAAYNLNLSKTKVEPGKITFYRKERSERPLSFRPIRTG